MIYQKQKNGKWEDQAYRYPNETWTADDARAHCKSHGGSFEAASGKEATEDTMKMAAFVHNSTCADNEPEWGSIDKSKLPRAAFARQGEPDKKSTWGFPHHWVSGGSKTDDMGCYTDGTMYLHRGGLGAAWAAANGARGGEKAEKAVLDHLDAHRKAIGMGEHQKEKGEKAMDVITKDQFKAAYPDLFTEIDKEAFERGIAEGTAKGKADGAEAERNRIKGVEDQLIPGHEALINELKYDGKTTGPEAAVMVLKKEKDLLGAKHNAMVEDGRKTAVPDAAPPAIEKPKEVEPDVKMQELVKEKMSKDPKLSYRAALEAVQKENPELANQVLEKTRPKKE